MVAEHPDVASGSSNKYQNWEVVDPEKWVPEGYACVRVDSARDGESPGTRRPPTFSSFRGRRATSTTGIEWAGVQPWSSGKSG